MDKKLLNGILAVAAALGLAGCSNETEAPAPETKAEAPAKAALPPPEPVAAQSAFSQMYRPARQWAADALPLSVTSGEIEGLKNDGGKAGMWTAVFVSPSRREARTLFYSAIDHGTTVRGVAMGGAQPWSGATAKSQPFNPTEFLINSDAAYQTAFAKAAPWVKTHPNKKLSLYLASASRGPWPVWIVMWGDTKSGYLAFVNATSGKIMANR
jgi:hypothetical protein